MKLSKLKDKLRGRPGAVLGGGPSLQSDYERLPPNCVLIAVNYHAAAIGIKPQYMVYNDDPESDPILWQSAKDFDGLRVSPHSSSDIEFDVEVWTGFYSSNTAAWFALWLGCDPVFLCGMDCYQGDAVYCHPTQMDVPVFHYPLEMHLRPWREEGLHLLPHVERVRVMSGPLRAVFPLWEPV